MKRCIVGVDFGATFVKLGLVDLHGNILQKSSFATGDFKSKDSLISKVVKEVRALMAGRRDILGLGVGVPGPVDYNRGIIYNLTNVKGWRNVPLKHILIKRLGGLTVYIDNDANAATLGEAEWGAGKGMHNIIGITLGSGVGGGVIIDGEIFRGRGYTAAELGHICIDRDGPACNCGSLGCLESFIGAGYINKEVAKRLQAGEKSILSKLSGDRFSAITPKLISEAAGKGDYFSVRLWQEVGVNLGIGLASLVNIFNPEIIVIGGGISKAGRILFDSIKKTVNKRAITIFTKKLKIERAKFIADAGVVGAAALVKKALKG